MSDVQLPRWAARARDVCRALLIVYALLWLVRGMVALVDVFGPDLLEHGSPRWLDLTVYALAGIWLLSGLTWLGGASIAGYREPRGE